MVEKNKAKYVWEKFDVLAPMLADDFFVAWMSGMYLSKVFQLDHKEPETHAWTWCANSGKTVSLSSPSDTQTQLSPNRESQRCVCDFDVKKKKI